MSSLPLFFAWRYLFSRKSRNVINLVSAVSSVGMCIGTAALVAILSVYNGFDALIKSSLSGVEPDLKVTAAAGKFFVPDSAAFDWVCSQECVSTVTSTVEDNVYVTCKGRNAVAKAIGADVVYEEESPLRNSLTEGEFSLHKGDIPMAVIGRGLAEKLQASPRFVGGMELHYPSRDGKFSPSNPLASLKSAKVWPSGIFSVNAEIDGQTVIVPVEVMRDLLSLDEEVSAVEIRMSGGTGNAELRRLAKGLEDRLGDGFRVKNRWQQNESLYRMMRWEKAAVYLILIFVIIIVAFNIFGSMQMLMIEKADDIRTIHAMGGTNELTRRVFVLEGWLTTLVGMAAGLVIGIAIVLLQQSLGFVKMPGSFGTMPYPVVLEAGDVIATAICVSAIGYIIALVPGMKGRG